MLYNIMFNKISQMCGSLNRSLEDTALTADMHNISKSWHVLHCLVQDTGHWPLYVQCYSCIFYTHILVLIESLIFF